MAGDSSVQAQIADDPTYDPSNPLGRTFGNLSPEGMKEHFRWVDLNKDKYPEFLVDCVCRLSPQLDANQRITTGPVDVVKPERSLVGSLLRTSATGHR